MSRLCSLLPFASLSLLVLCLSPPLDAYLSPARGVTFPLYPVGVLGPGDQEAELPPAGGSPVFGVVKLVSVLGVPSIEGRRVRGSFWGFRGHFEGRGDNLLEVIAGQLNSSFVAAYRLKAKKT